MGMLLQYTRDKKCNDEPSKNKDNKVYIVPFVVLALKLWAALFYEEWLGDKEVGRSPFWTLHFKSLHGKAEWKKRKCEPHFIVHVMQVERDHVIFFPLQLQPDVNSVFKGCCVEQQKASSQEQSVQLLQGWILYLLIGLFGLCIINIPLLSTLVQGQWYWRLHSTLAFGRGMIGWCSENHWK